MPSCESTEYKDFIQTTYEDSGITFSGATDSTGEPIRYIIEDIFDLFSNIPNKVGDYSYAEWYNSALGWTDYAIFNFNDFDAELASSVIESYFAANNATQYSIFLFDEEGDIIPAHAYNDYYNSINVNTPISIKTPFHYKKEILAYDFHYSVKSISVYKVNSDKSEELVTGTDPSGNEVFNLVTLSPGENIFKESIELTNSPFETDEGDTITVNRYFYINGSEVSTYYLDSDGDGYGDPNSPCEETYQPSGYVTDNTDCDDTDPDVYPGAEEICDNGIDDDCDGAIDEDCGAYSGECGAYVAPGVWKEFDCYNLAAIGKKRGADPFTPSWELIGGYWQWGRKGPDESEWYDTNTSNFAHGPTGSDQADANDDSIDVWDDSDADDDAWFDDQKTSKDPCPPGYHVPYISQWNDICVYNECHSVGTWSENTTNYTSAKFIGDYLMLPAAGGRHPSSGELGGFGRYGLYWSNIGVFYDSTAAWALELNSQAAIVNSAYRIDGGSVRCIAE